MPITHALLERWRDADAGASSANGKRGWRSLLTNFVVAVLRVTSFDAVGKGVARVGPRPLFAWMAAWCAGGRMRDGVHRRRLPSSRASADHKCDQWVFDAYASAGYPPCPHASHAHPALVTPRCRRQVRDALRHEHVRLGRDGGDLPAAHETAPDGPPRCRPSTTTSTAVFSADVALPWWARGARAVDAVRASVAEGLRACRASVAGAHRTRRDPHRIGSRLRASHLQTPSHYLEGHEPSYRLMGNLDADLAAHLLQLRAAWRAHRRLHCLRPRHPLREVLRSCPAGPREHALPLARCSREARSRAGRRWLQHSRRMNSGWSRPSTCTACAMLECARAHLLRSHRRASAARRAARVSRGGRRRAVGAVHSLYDSARPQLRRRGNTSGDAGVGVGVQINFVAIRRAPRSQ